MTDLLEQSSGMSFSGNHNLHLSIFDGDLYKYDGYDVFYPVGTAPTTRQWRPSSSRSNHTSSPSVPASESIEGHSTSSHIGPSLTGLTSLRSKDRVTSSGVTETPIHIFLFKRLKMSTYADVWEAGAIFPGNAGLVSVVAKIACSPCLENLIAEAKAYSHLTSNPFIQLPIPTFYGMYYCPCEGSFVGLLLMSLVPGVTADGLSDMEIRAAMCIHVALKNFTH